ncbi:MFS transporter [Kribbella jiaozuonensis]|uniref:MFS transporter n=1 Tax=Kribbella jiaozuonensis TaxID=2575441 RepID=A0A4U3LLX0_9ACTN|nr:MFS transporter [Kribbella jiaozuonensis]TKK76758.1 MFS transporter [Kribbella jiaozuonensis]
MTVEISAAGRVLLDRLERLPLSRPHVKLLLMGGLGIAFDGMDGSLVSYLLPAVKPLWHLAPWQIGLIGSSLLIGILIGALSAGITGDAIGRRKVMMYALALYCAATLVAAFAPTWEIFFSARIIAGIGVGAEAAIIPAFIAEFIPARSRGLLVGSVAGFFSAGYVASALLGRVFVPAFDHGWRVAQVVTALPVLMLLWWRRGLLESPRWLIQQGRTAEATKVVDALEDAVRESGKDVPPVPAAAPETTVSVPRKPKPGAGLILMWQNGLARRTAVLWLLWISITFAFFGFFTWIPSLLVERDLTISKSLSYALLITLAQVPGYYSGAYLNERLDRKWTIASYLAGGAISAFLIANASSNGQVLFFGILLSFFMNGTYAGLYAYTPEVYPTAIRATGMGTASAVGRFGGITAPILIGVLFTSVGFLGVFSMIAAALLLGALAILTLGLSTRGRRLEDLDPEAQVERASAPIITEAATS